MLDIVSQNKANTYIIAQVEHDTLLGHFYWNIGSMPLTLNQKQLCLMTQWYRSELRIELRRNKTKLKVVLRRFVEYSKPKHSWSNPLDANYRWIKAVDTIDYSILLHKLRQYGFQGIINKWFSSYVQNGLQYTGANGNKSTHDKLIRKYHRAL